MWQTFYLWEQVTWRKSLRTAVTQRKLSNCFVFAAGRILSSHLLSSVNFSGRLKDYKHSYVSLIWFITPSNKLFTVSFPVFRLHIPTLTNSGPIWICFCKSYWLRTPGRLTGRSSSLLAQLSNWNCQSVPFFFLSLFLFFLFTSWRSHKGFTLKA